MSDAAVVAVELAGFAVVLGLPLLIRWRAARGRPRSGSWWDDLD